MHRNALLCKPKICQRLPCGYAHLRLHQVNIGDFFGDGVLDLDSGVHFNKYVLALIWTHGIDQELNGSGVLIAKLFGKIHCIFI